MARGPWRSGAGGALAHLWQFLVGDGWQCNALLDWEHAGFDDPDWDLAMLDGSRWTAVGTVPDEFFAGYGRRPSSPLYWLYRVERAAWILAAWARREQWLELSVPPAEPSSPRTRGGQR